MVQDQRLACAPGQSQAIETRPFGTCLAVTVTPVPCCLVVILPHVRSTFTATVTTRDRLLISLFDCYDVSFNPSSVHAQLMLEAGKGEGGVLDHVLLRPRPQLSVENWGWGGGARGSMVGSNCLIFPAANTFQP